MRVRVVATGVANLASVRVALARCGAEAAPAEGAADVESAPAVVLPGVGAFGAGMGALRAAGMVDALRARVERGLPTLAICLGMQMLFEESEESPGVRGLGVAPGRVGRFAGGGAVRVPQLGWNGVSGAGLIEPGAAYFANSYRVAEAPEGWECAWADHGGRFVAAMRRGGVLACQFHPELSGAWGLALIRRWLGVSREVTPC